MKIGLWTSLLALGAAGCHSYPSAPPRGDARITLQPRLPGGMAYAVQDALEGYQARDVKTIVLSLFTVDGASVLPVMAGVGTDDERAVTATLTNDGSDFAGARVTFSNLRRETTYRIVAEAFGLDADGHAQPLARADGSSRNDVYVGADDQEADRDVDGHSPIVVPVRLIPKIFSARQTSADGVAITPGIASPVPFTP